MTLRREVNESPSTEPLVLPSYPELTTASYLSGLPQNWYDWADGGPVPSIGGSPVVVPGIALRQVPLIAGLSRGRVYAFIMHPVQYWSMWLGIHVGI